MGCLAQAAGVNTPNDTALTFEEHTIGIPGAQRPTMSLVPSPVEMETLGQLLLTGRDGNSSSSS